MDREHATSDEHRPEPAEPRPGLEWLASGVGLVLACAVFGFIGWQALYDPATPPVITVAVERVAPIEGGYRVEFRARNKAGLAAAQVAIEGKLSGAGGADEIGRVLFDYIPGHSSRTGGLLFTRDPRTGTLSLRASGFASP